MGFDAGRGVPSRQHVLQQGFGLVAPIAYDGGPGCLPSHRTGRRRFRRFTGASFSKSRSSGSKSQCYRGNFRDV